jgi:hypothetical protein
MKFSFFKGAVLSSILCLCLAGAFVACSHDMPVSQQQQPPANLQATLSSIQANIFTPKCTNPGCHPGAGGGPVSLRPGESFNGLVNVNSAYGIPRVSPGNANNSVLYLKVIGNNNYGGIMPAVGPRLSQAETDTIAAWINRGALNN